VIFFSLSIIQEQTFRQLLEKRNEMVEQTKKEIGIVIGKNRDDEIKFKSSQMGRDEFESIMKKNKLIFDV